MLFIKSTVDRNAYKYDILHVDSSTSQKHLFCLWLMVFIRVFIQNVFAAYSDTYNDKLL